MAAMLTASPVAACGSNFRSPLRGLKAASFDASSDELFGDAQANIARWRKELMSSASFEAQQSLRELRHEREELKDLHADLQGVKSMVQVAAQLRESGAKLSDVLRSSSDAQMDRSRVVACVKDDLDMTCESRRQDLAHIEKEIAQQKALSEKQHAEALKLLAVYQDRLGFTISREACQTVRMAFSLIDPGDLEKEFCFTLGLASADGKGSDSYCVRDCTPELPGLSKLVAELNAEAASASALPRFVCRMRKAFANLCKSSQKA